MGEQSEESTYVDPNFCDGKPSENYLPEIKENFFRFIVPEEVKKEFPERFNK